MSGTTNNTADVLISAISDQISQEGKETIELPLSVTSDELPVTVFVDEPAMITVNDKSGEIVNVLDDPPLLYIGLVCKHIYFTLYKFLVLYICS